MVGWPWLVHEAGGQLFATFQGSTVQVVKATGPRKSDRRSRFRFLPNRNAERIEIKRLFHGGLHYVGDWHTHPQTAPTPSTTDISNITDMFKKSEHELAGFIMIIVGLDPLPEGLFVGVCNDEGLTQLEKCHPGQDV